MSKLYALFSGEYSDTSFWGVYSTRELAQAQINKAVAVGKTSYCSLGDPDPSSGGRIQEVETDTDWSKVGFNKDW